MTLVGPTSAREVCRSSAVIAHLEGLGFIRGAKAVFPLTGESFNVPISGRPFGRREIENDLATAWRYLTDPTYRNEGKVELVASPVSRSLDGYRFGLIVATLKGDRHRLPSTDNRLFDVQR